MLCCQSGHISSSNLDVLIRLASLANMESGIDFGSKAIAKLIDVISKGIGTYYKPKAIRKEAEAEAYKIETIARAEAKATLIRGEAEIELLTRVKERIYNQEVRRQENIEAVAERSFKYLPDDISNEPVDSNWRTRFFNKAQDISVEEMQEVWARILAGEVAKPGSIGVRTLEVVSNISTVEAQKFQFACSLASGHELIWRLGKRGAFEEFGLRYGDLMLLREAGLVQEGDNLIRLAPVIPDIRSALQPIGKDLYQIQSIRNRSQKQYQLKQVAFTQAGKELCKLIDMPLNASYRDALISAWQAEGYIVSKFQDPVRQTAG